MGQADSILIEHNNSSTLEQTMEAVVANLTAQVNPMVAKAMEEVVARRRVLEQDCMAWVSREVLVPDMDTPEQTITSNK